MNIGTQADWFRARRKVDCGQQIATVAKNFDLPDTGEKPMVLWFIKQNHLLRHWDQVYRNENSGFVGLAV